MNISFKDLRSIILKSCVTDDQSTEITDRCSFTIDISKLEGILKQKKTELHVLAFDKMVKSRVPGYNDIQLITEYMKKPEEIDNTFNSTTQFCQILLYTKSGMEDKMQICDDNNNPISDKELFNICNNPEEINSQQSQAIIYGIVKYLPMYKILVTRDFNYSSDAFKYKIYIRSNYQMVNYFKGISAEKSDSE